jgi:hypothetical protein
MFGGPTALLHYTILQRLAVFLGGLVVIFLVIGPKVRRFKSSVDDGFLMAIKIRSKTSLGGEAESRVVRLYGILKIRTL